MTDPNSVLNSLKDTFAPLTEALKNVPPIEVPQAARDFVKQSATTAKLRAAELQAGTEKVTGALETALSGTLGETAKAARTVQQAIYEDTDAFLSGLDKLASATSLTEAMQIQSDLIRSRGEVAVARAKAASEYVGKLFADNAKTLRDNLADAAQFTRKAG
jgi:phasin